MKLFWILCLVLSACCAFQVTKDYPTKLLSDLKSFNSTKHDLKAKITSLLPAYLNWQSREETSYVSEVRDQMIKDCNSNTIFATISTIESLFRIHDKKNLTLSPGDFIWFHNRHACDTGTKEKHVYHHAYQYGLVQEKCNPYNASNGHFKLSKVVRDYQLPDDCQRNKVAGYLKLHFTKNSDGNGIIQVQRYEKGETETETINLFSVKNETHYRYKDRYGDPYDPYTKTFIETVKEINAENVMRLILTHYGPVTVNFNIHLDFLFHTQGIYSRSDKSAHFTKFLTSDFNCADCGDETACKFACNTGPVFSQFVTLIGYGTDNGQKYWLAKNTWGKNWAEQGIFKIKRGTNEANFESVITVPILV